MRPERNEFRYYRLEVWPDLFGRALLARHWGRLDTQGRMGLDPAADKVTMFELNRLSGGTSGLKAALWPATCNRTR